MFKFKKSTLEELVMKAVGIMSQFVYFACVCLDMMSLFFDMFWFCSLLSRWLTKITIHWNFFCNMSTDDIILNTSGHYFGQSPRYQHCYLYSMLPMILVMICFMKIPKSNAPFAQGTHDCAKRVEFKPSTPIASMSTPMKKWVPMNLHPQLLQQ